MKSPLRYQLTEYDCGPTALLNAISFLFEREDIPPEVVRNIMLYSLDSVNEFGQSGRLGTSEFAMSFLARWIDGVGKAGLLPVSARFLKGEKVSLDQDSVISSSLSRNAVAVVRVIAEVGHYVLITKLDRDHVFIFDSYRRDDSFSIDGVRSEEKELEYNFAVERRLFNRDIADWYSLGPVNDREAVILFNEKTRIKEEDLVEYFI